MFKVLPFVLPVSRGSWGNIIILFVSGIILFLMSLIPPFAIQAIVDRVLTSNNLSTLKVIVALLIGIAVFEVILGGLRGFIAMLTSFNMGVRASSHLYSNLFRSKRSLFGKFNTGELLARGGELTGLSDVVTNRGFELVFEVFSGIAFFVILFWINSTMTLLILAGAVIQVLLFLAFGPFLRHYSRKVFDRGAELSNSVMVSVSNPVQVKGLQMETTATRHITERLDKSNWANWKLGLLSMASGSLHGVLWGVMTPVLIFIGASLVMNGNLTLGQALAFQMFSGRVIDTLETLAGLHEEWQELRISAERLGDIAFHDREAPGQQSGVAMTTPSLQLADWSAGYGADSNSDALVKKLDLTIPAGTSLGVVGGSGAGKTVFAQSLIRLHEGQGGYSLNGAPTDPLSAPQLRRYFTYATNQDVLIGDDFLNALDMAAGQEVNGDEAWELLAMMGLADHLEAKFGNLEFEVDQVHTLVSAGQYQRLTLTRAIMRKAPVLILDEATNALDQQTEARLIRQLLADKTRSLIFITHRPHLLGEMDQVLWMDQGAQAGLGAHEELMRFEGYQKLWGQPR